MDKHKKKPVIPGTLPNGQPDEMPPADPEVPELPQDAYDMLPDEEEDLMSTPPYEPPDPGEGP
ncbi:MAG: hypothetical protein U0X40_06475 [Ferruginibacter sp.]